MGAQLLYGKNGFVGIGCPSQDFRYQIPGKEARRFLTKTNSGAITVMTQMLPQRFAYLDVLPVVK